MLPLAVGDGVQEGLLALEMPVGAVQGSGLQVKVAGLSVPREQLRLDIDAV
jgi:hypothetical protein